jgi:hypothetical protein
MPVRRALLLALALVGSWLPVLTVTPAGHAEEQSMSGYVTMVSESGDWVGAGLARTYRSITVNRTDSFLGMYAGPFTFRIGAPDGRKLEPGHYDALATTAGTAAELDIFGNGRGCAGPGSFVVLDIAPDRVWIRYEFRCEGDDPALFGEIRLGYGEETSPLGVEAGIIGYPSEHPGVPVRPYPVRVANNGSAPAAVTASVTAGSDDFAVLGNDCPGVLAPATACTVYVGFTPGRAGTRLGMLEISDDRGNLREISLSGVGIRGRTEWHMRGEVGDYIGGNRSYDYTARQGARMGGGGTETSAWMGVDYADDWWDAQFRAPQGQILLPGRTYTGATRYGFNAGNPGLDVSGNGRGCNTLTGQFTVHEATYDNGYLTSFRISFEQHCEGSTPALRGEVSWRAVDTAAPTPDTTPPGPVTGLTAGPSGASVPLSWTNPTDADWVDTVILGASGTRAVTEGRLVYDGRRTSTTVTGFPTGLPYTLTVFTEDTSGNLSPVRTVTIPATTTAPPPPPTTTDPTSTPTSTPTTSASPTPAPSPAPTTQSGPTTASPVRTVSLQATRIERRGVRLTGRSGTWAAGARALLQRRTDRGWSAVATKRFSPSGRVRFLVDAPRRGAVRYRLVARTDGPAVVSPAVRVRR